MAGGRLTPAPLSLSLVPCQAVVGRFAEDFVEERRRSLEMFIKRVVAHPILRETEWARVFLQGSDQVTGRAPDLPAPLTSTAADLAHRSAAPLTAPSLPLCSVLRTCPWPGSSA